MSSDCVAAGNDSGNGKLIANYKVATTPEPMTINVKKWATGHYIIRLWSKEKKTFTAQFVRQ